MGKVKKQNEIAGQLYCNRICFLSVSVSTTLFGKRFWIKIRPTCRRTIKYQLKQILMPSSVLFCCKGTFRVLITLTPDFCHMLHKCFEILHVLIAGPSHWTLFTGKNDFGLLYSFGRQIFSYFLFTKLDFFIFCY